MACRARPSALLDAWGPSECARSRVSAGGWEYTDALTAALLEAAEGGTAANVLQTGALEACSGLVSRAFAVADVKASTAIQAALHPAAMAQIGRALIRTGELVLYIDVDAGAIRLLPCTDVEVSGNASPDTWRYK